MLDLDTLTLSKGSHKPPNGDAEFCLLEAVSYFAGEPWGFRPACVSPVLISFGYQLNDVLPDDLRQQLVPLIPRLVGTAGDGQDEARSYMALDWLIRTYTPAWLDLAGLGETAAELRGLRRIVDTVAAQQAGPVVRKGRDKVRAAREAAREAAGGAAWGAAGGAAWEAAWGATREAAWEAAWGAAREAAWEAAREAARGAARGAAGEAAREAAGEAAWGAAGGAAWEAAGGAAWEAAWEAAWGAAREAAGEAAGGAAREAAGEAAGEAARGAARGATREAAWEAAREAAGEAARAVLAPTVTQLQLSAIECFTNMIDPADGPRST